MVNVVAPYVASFELSGNGKVEALAHASVTITAIEYLYIAALGDVANRILVKNVDSSDGEVDISVNWYSGTAEDDGAGFIAALATQMAAAVGGALSANASFGTDNTLPGTSDISGGAAQTMNVTMLELTRAEINYALQTNELSTFLESDVVGLLTLRVDWSAGAADMRTGLNPLRRQQMFLQIPNRALPGADQAETDASGGVMARTLDYFLNTGDKLAFVFDVAREVALAQSVVAAPTEAGAQSTVPYPDGTQGSAPSVTPANADYASQGLDTTDPFANSGPLNLSYNLASHRVGFILSK